MDVDLTGHTVELCGVRNPVSHRVSVKTRQWPTIKSIRTRGKGKIYLPASALICNRFSTTQCTNTSVRQFPKTYPHQYYRLTRPNLDFPAVDQFTMSDNDGASQKNSNLYNGEQVKCFKAPWPFDEPDTDLIVRSSDGIEYSVYSNIMSIASSDFKSRIKDLPPTVDSPRVLEIPVNSVVLDSLLRFCYPITCPTFRTVEQLEPVLKAAMVYDVKIAADYLKERLRINLSTWDPLKVYACACRLSLREEARHAILLLRDKPANTVDNAVLDDIPALDYIRLVRFNRTKDVAALEHLRKPLCNPSSTAAQAKNTKSDKQWKKSGNSATFASVLTSHHTTLHPFDDVSSADAILQSSDAVQFHVVKGFMSYASPFFQDMFTLPQETPSANGPLKKPVIPMTEDSNTLEDLLPLCYPPPSCATPLTENLDRLRCALMGAIKYDMHGAIRILREKLDLCIHNDPIGVYAIATSLDLTETYVKAAKYALRNSTADWEDSPQWEHVLAGGFRRLQHYHNACGLASAQVVSIEGNNMPSWYTKPIPQWVSAGCHISTYNSHTNPWAPYMAYRAKFLQEQPGDLSIVAPQVLMNSIMTERFFNCASCRPKALLLITEMQTFCNEMEVEIQRRIEEVSISNP
jgi:hypothetical protein